VRALTAIAACALGAGCGGAAGPWTEPPAAKLDLELAVSATKVGLLEPITVHLDLFRMADVEVDFAPKVDAADFLAEVTTQPERQLHGGRWQRTTLVLRPVRGPAELVLPPFVAKAKDGSTASTPEQRIVVESVLAGHGAAIEAPGEPFPSPSRFWWWVVGGTMAGLLVGVLQVLWRARRPRAQPDEVGLPPHVKALRALARLAGAPRTTEAQVEAFYVEVSAVLRVYLEERFGLRAPERTTEEFLRELEGGDQLAREHRAELERFLSQCDLVKFAAVVPDERQHLATHALAEAFVSATRPDRVPTAVAT
jgi:hypothetical protein